MAASTFNFAEVVLVLDGFRIEGFGDTDDAVQVEVDEDNWTLTNGADGSVMRHRVLQSSAMVTITLLYGSRSNAILQELLNSERKFALSFRDTRGGYLLESPDAYVVRRPNQSIGRAAADVEWQIQCMTSTSSHQGINDLAVDG